jgi:hypothetical protein
MREKRSREKSLKAQRKAAVRASITFPPDLYKTLEEIHAGDFDVAGALSHQRLLGSPGGLVLLRQQRRSTGML